MENQKFKIIALSPVHIGSNISIEPIEYAIVDGYLYWIDMDKILFNKRVAELLIKKSDKISEIRSNLYTVCSIFKEKNVLDRFTKRKIKIFQSVEEEYRKNLFQGNGLLTIGLFPSNPYPYIPGSSIKGAIRTGVLNILSKEKKYCGRERRWPSNLEHCILNAQERDRNGKWRNVFFKSVFQYLYISDVMIEGETEIFEAGNYSFKRHNTKIPMRKEVFTGENSEVYLDVSFDRERAKRQNVNLLKKLNDFVYMANEFYEKKFWEERDRIAKDGKVLPNKNDIVAYLDHIGEKIKQKGEDEYLLRVGWGSGYNCNTLDGFRYWPKPKKARQGQGWGYSINLVEARRPLGWVLLKEV